MSIYIGTKGTSKFIRQRRSNSVEITVTTYLYDKLLQRYKITARELT